MTTRICAGPNRGIQSQSLTDIGQALCNANVGDAKSPVSPLTQPNEVTCFISDRSGKFKICLQNYLYFFSSQVQRSQNYKYIYILHIYNLSKAKGGEGENPGSKPSSCTGEGIDTAHQAGVSMQRQGHSAGEGGVDAARRLGASTQRAGRGR